MVVTTKTSTAEAEAQPSVALSSSLQTPFVAPAGLAATENVAAAANSGSSGSDGSDASSEGSEADDLVWHFKQAGVPKSQGWARKVVNAGYANMDELSGNLDELADEIGIPSGVKTKMAAALAGLANGEGGPRMPEGDLNKNAPVQPPASYGWKVALGVFVGLLAIGDCLDGDTEITMADRTKKKIKLLKAGEKVLSFNNGKLKVKTILEVMTGRSSNVFPLTLKSEENRVFSLNATGGHPFYTRDDQWSAIAPQTKALGKLEKGSRVVLRGGKTAEVVEIGRRTSSETFNLVVDGPGVFFVHDILSHSGLPPRK